jgi:choline dehydrogenase-like flavoprotein
MLLKMLKPFIMIYDLIVIGGGAGGCFCAIRLAELKPGSKILILEAARKPLSKVEIPVAVDAMSHMHVSIRKN